jgi:hypothetical protein
MLNGGITNEVPFDFSIELLNETCAGSDGWYKITAPETTDTLTTIKTTIKVNFLRYIVTYLDNNVFFLPICLILLTIIKIFTQ